jgi:peptidoglycan/xylan/chitin deacetylase (PgdA/CDA1 family)
MKSLNSLVLCYHAVSERWPADLSVTPDALDAQLGFLARRGYRGVPFSELALSHARERVVAITFDDSYLSVLERAAPILARHGFPGTVFVPTAFVGSTEPMSWPGIENWLGTEHEEELIPLDWEQLRTLKSRGWEIGSHTRTHPHLTRLDDRELARELSESKRECEAGVGGVCQSLAYPYGDHDQRVVGAAADAGYETAGTLPTDLHAPSTLRWPRIGVYHRDGRARFALKTLAPLRRLRGSAPGRRATGLARRL